MLEAIKRLRDNKAQLRKKKLFKQKDKKGLLGRGDTDIELPQATPKEIEAYRKVIYRLIRRQRVKELTTYLVVTLMVITFFLWLFLR